MNEVHRWEAVHMKDGDNNIRYQDGTGPDMVKASDYDQLNADNEAYKKLHDWFKAENEVLTLRVMAGERQELDALKSAPVVMPERQNCDGRYGKKHAYADGWNDCLDEFERLNRSKTHAQ